MSLASIPVLLRGEGLRLAAVSASATSKFLTVQSAAHGSGWAKAVAVALRCLLRFLHVEGLIIAPLAQVVPTRRVGWSLPAKGIEAREPGRCLREL